MYKLVTLYLLLDTLKVSPPKTNLSTVYMSYT